MSPTGELSKACSILIVRVALTGGGVEVSEKYAAPGSSGSLPKGDDILITRICGGRVRPLEALGAFIAMLHSSMVWRRPLSNIMVYVGNPTHRHRVGFAIWLTPKG